MGYPPQDFGATAVKTSGECIRISGQVVHISGQPVFVENISGARVEIGGIVIEISGDIVRLASGTGPVGVSGQTIIGKVSGETLISKVSGEVVKVSGETLISKVSGEVVKVSGETVSIETPTTIKTGAIRVVTAASGGAVLHSGPVLSVNVKSLSGDIWIGGSGDRPYSGFGFLLAAGEVKSIDIDDFNRIYLCANTSGNWVSFMGVK